MATTHWRATKTARGFTLIEALVAAAVLGLGIWGASTLTLHSLNAGSASHQQITALALANNTVEYWRGGPTLCPASAALSTVANSSSSATLNGTTYSVRSGVSPTSYTQLQAIQVTVSWRPSGNSINDNPMAPGSGQLVISTRASCVPVFVPLTSP